MIRIGSIVLRVDDLQRQTEFWEAALNSLMLAAAAAALAVGFAVVLAYARRQTRSQLIQAASTLPAISYAIPGNYVRQLFQRQKGN